MAAIATLVIDRSPAADDAWAQIVRLVVDWTTNNGIELRDAVLLVPFAQLLPSVRRAFSATAGWMPRIETSQTLARSLAPPPAAEPGLISFDRGLDRLAAEQLLRAQPWGAAWAARDMRGFRRAVTAVVDAAQGLARSACAQAPGERVAFWQRAREMLAPVAGPGASERLLARVAVEWASVTATPSTDALFDLRPTAWICLRAGGADAYTTALLDAGAAAGVPGLLLDTDPPHEDVVAAFAPPSEPAFARCDGFEHEAQCAAAQVLEHLRRGESPVALVAQDRVLVRRVRALLERRHVRLLDETGWTLSTTRAAARITGLLAAAASDAGTDALIDWLKTGTAWPDVRDVDSDTAALEAALRKAKARRVSGVSTLTLDDAAARQWAPVAGLLQKLAPRGRHRLDVWLRRLDEALQACGVRVALEADDAGRQVLAALRLDAGSAGDTLFAAQAQASPMNFDEFSAWVAQVFEDETFLPASPADAAAQVILLPLARVMLRPFAALVLPGADERRLGAPPPPPALLSDAQAAAIGLPTVAQRRCAEAIAFAQALQVPRVTLLRRHVDDGEPLADSPLVEQLALALAKQGRTLATWHDPRQVVRVVAAPIGRPAPPAAGLLPTRLSASACEALRDCPYRFFALNLLRLREADELEAEIEKRDYGTWLHAVLHAFHLTRTVPGDASAETARLLALAAKTQADQGLADDEFLPFTASFASFAPRYVAWLHGRDRRGAVWFQGEHELGVRPEPLDGVELRGIVDRIDTVGTDRVDLIDYKTGSADSLRRKVRDPQEDTQLAFYAALVAGHGEARRLGAMYLALDGSKGLEEIVHPDVEFSARRLVDGLADDLRRLRAGAGLPALGEGSTCEHCEARGLCRRDHWTEAGAP